MFKEPSKELEAFSVVRRMKSFRHAFRGIAVLVRTQHNMWVHIAAMIAAIMLGAWLQISPVEWCLIVFSIGLVVVTEAINTAIEFDIDLTSPEEHPFARDTKDVAAAAVLISAAVAVIVGCIIFLPKIVFLLK